MEARASSLFVDFGEVEFDGEFFMRARKKEPPLKKGS
jgi:hypothetical protein